jgi:FKBP-type peptidyl-prolyl cis-trans isomerase (trigger factor)
MKTELKKIDACKRQLSIELPKEIITKKFDEVYEELGKNAQIKGFRPGKAPREILEKHHSALAREEVLKSLIPEYYQKALEQEKLSAVDLPEIQDVLLKDGVLSFKAEFEIAPEIKIKKYKGLKVKRKSASVNEEEVKKAVEYLKQARKKEGANIDDTFARGLGYPSVQELESTVRKQLEISKEQQVKVDIENQIIDQLLKNTELDVPKASVEKQLTYMVRQAQENLLYQGMKKEEVEAKQEELRKTLKDDAAQAVKIYFILDKIAELEHINVEKQQDFTRPVIEFLLKEAEWQEGGKDGV